MATFQGLASYSVKTINTKWASWERMWKILWRPGTDTLITYNELVPTLRISCRIQETSKAEVCFMKGAAHTNCTHILVFTPKTTRILSFFFGLRWELEECIFWCMMVVKEAVKNRFILTKIKEWEMSTLLSLPEFLLFTQMNFHPSRTVPVSHAIQKTANPEAWS